MSSFVSRALGGALARAVDAALARRYPLGVLSSPDALLGRFLHYNLEFRCARGGPGGGARAALAAAGVFAASAAAAGPRVLLAPPTRLSLAAPDDAAAAAAAGALALLADFPLFSWRGDDGDGDDAAAAGGAR